MAKHAWMATLLLALIAQRAQAHAKAALSFVREPGAERCIAALELGQRIEDVVGPVLASASEAQLSIESSISYSAKSRKVESTARCRSPGAHEGGELCLGCHGWSEDLLVDANSRSHSDVWRRRSAGV